MFKIELDKEMAWLTFFGEGWESTWYPVTDSSGNQLAWSEDIMDFCREQFNDSDNWVSFGVAPTSQMLVENSVRDNL